MSVAQLIEFCVINAEADEQTQTVDRELYLTRSQHRWLDENAAHTGESPNYILNEAAYFGSIRCLAMERELSCFLKSTVDDTEFEFPLRQRSFGPSESDRIAQVTLRGPVDALANRASRDHNAPLEQVTADGIRILGAFATFPNTIMYVSYFRLVRVERLLGHVGIGDLNFDITVPYTLPPNLAALRPLNE